MCTGHTKEVYIYSSSSSFEDSKKGRQYIKKVHYTRPSALKEYLPSNNLKMSLLDNMKCLSTHSLEEKLFQNQVSFKYISLLTSLR